jgi:hypothetical protein
MQARGGALTTQDKVRRTAIVLLVLACLVGLGVAVAQTREVDALGDPVTEDRDPSDVVESGDAEVLATVPPLPDPNAPDLDDIVEQLYPARDSEALQQQQVGIDLGPTYTGVLVLNGVEIPEEQLQRRPELNQVFFQPGDDLAVEELTPGRNCVTALVWRVEETREDSRAVNWCFEVT